MNSCASSYKMINPNNLNYNSTDLDNGVSLSYKYDLLKKKKYSKKETKRGVKLVAIKITNNSDKDLVFGQDISLTYENGNGINIMDSDKVFKSLKQGTLGYLLYLLLTPAQLTKTETTNGITTTESLFPIGLILGPGLAGGNMLAASSANTKFKNELLNNDLNGMTIKKGETKSGLIGIRTDNYDVIKIKVNQ
jgi:hypothetical protein